MCLFHRSIGSASARASGGARPIIGLGSYGRRDAIQPMPSAAMPQHRIKRKPDRTGGSDAVSVGTFCQARKTNARRANIEGQSVYFALLAADGRARQDGSTKYTLEPYHMAHGLSTEK